MIRDDFAGPGGWDEGLRLLDLSDVVGVEWDRWACETAMAAGHRRVRADVRHVPPEPWDIDGYVASPPCTSFSAAGKGAGMAVLPAIVAAARSVAAGADVPDDVGGDETTALILQPVRQVRDLRPRWVALEQVPSCLPIWQEYARLFRQWGYSASCAVLCAADFGVPQTRRRAILVARLDGPALLPEPTHAEHPADGLFGPALWPWVSMAEALGWGFEETPGRTMCGARSPRWLYDDPDGTHGRIAVDRGQTHGGVHSVDDPSPCLSTQTRSWVYRRPATTLAGSNPGIVFPNGGGPEVSMSERGYFPWGEAEEWALTRPATTVVSTRGADVIAAPGWRGPGGPSRQDQPGSIRITPQEAATLQSFPPDYPWQGPKTAQFSQIGNAWCPRAAAAVVGALLGLPWQSALDAAG